MIRCFIHIEPWWRLSYETTQHYNGFTIRTLWIGPFMFVVMNGD